ncbi:Asp-tRNA(Asn)/Glu-tRNA(Gln) amidotransferase subunit GatC [soil metagenome]
MALKTTEVEYIAHLARISINEEDIPGYAHNLSKILDLMTEMDSVDTTQIQPMAHPLHLHQRLREDVVTETDQHELFQSMAPQIESDLYLVPQVIET